MDPAHILLLSFNNTLQMMLRMGSVMFLSLFGIELLMQMGLMKYLKPVGKPVAKIANLPYESAVTFLSAIGSMIAAHTMTEQFRSDGRLTDREVILTGVLNTVPFHFKEILTFQLPIVLPLLGLKLSLIYVAAFLLTGVLKLLFVLFQGRMNPGKRQFSDDVFSINECAPDDEECLSRSFFRLFLDAWDARKKMFLKMMLLLFSVTLIIQILINSGMLKLFEKLIQPFTSFFGLPASVVGPVSAYVFSPKVGIAYMSNLLNQSLVTEYQAIAALLAGALLMIPFMRLRRTLPRYIAIYGFKNGAGICGITTFISMLSRALILIWVMFFY